MVENNEQFEDVIELIDEEGNEVKFCYEDTVELNGNQYVVLLPLDGSDDDEYEEVVILKLDKNEDGEECLITIESEEEENAVFDEFYKKREEEFDGDE